MKLSITSRIAIQESNYRLISSSWSIEGERSSVEKELESTVTTNAVYQDKINILFSGIVVVAGRARAVVVGVGSNTAMGSIRDSMLKTEDALAGCDAQESKKKLKDIVMQATRFDIMIQVQAKTAKKHIISVQDLKSIPDIKQLCSFFYRTLMGAIAKQQHRNGSNQVIEDVKRVLRLSVQLDIKT